VHGTLALGAAKTGGARHEEEASPRTVSSALFLWLAMRASTGRSSRIAIERTRWLYLVPAVVLTMLGHFIRSIRWKYMMDPIKRCGIRPLWSATAIAFMVNNLLPARLGELVRAFVIGRSQNVSRSASFATIVYERVVDVFVLILLLWFCMVRISGRSGWHAARRSWWHSTSPCFSCCGRWCAGASASGC
jgi:uncharacterized protein (TIRG00374 family)